MTSKRLDKANDVRFRSLAEMTTFGDRISRFQQSKVDAANGVQSQSEKIFGCWQGFNDEVLEGTFVISLMQNWSIRIGLSGFLAITMVVTDFQDFDPVGGYLFIATTVFWGLATILFCVLKASEWLVRCWQQQSDLLIFAASAQGRTLPLRCAKAAEVVTLVLMYGGNVLYTMGNVVNRRTCKAVNNDPAACLDRYGFNMNEIIVFLFISLMSPVRFHLAVFSAIVNFLAFALTYMWISLSSRQSLYATTMLLATQLVACVIMVYYREAQQRNTLLMRRDQEHAMKQTKEVRKMAVQTAVRHIPDHVVKCLSVSGAYFVEGDGIVVGFALANFGHWCAGRGPRDAITVAADLVEAYTGCFNLLFLDPRFQSLQLPKFGDAAMFVFFPKLDAHLGECVDCVFTATVASVARAEECCWRHSVGSSSNTMLTPSSFIENWTSQRPVPCYIHPLCAVTMGGVHAWYAAAISSLLATGAAVEECTIALQKLSDVIQKQPRVHISENVAAARSASATDVVGNSNDKSSTSLCLEGEGSGAPFRGRAVVADGSEPPRMLSQGEEDVVTMASCSNPLIHLEGPSACEGSSVETQRIHRAEEPPEAQTATARRFVSVHAPSKKISENVTLESEYRCIGFIPRFVNSNTENAFLDHQMRSFNVHALMSNALSMLLTGIAMFCVCVLYGRLYWALRSPLPYVVGCCIAALALLVFVHQEVQHVFVLDACYWVFCFSCLASSAMSPQFSSIFGNSIFPWCLISAIVAFQRPLWYRPLTMFALELCMGIFLIMYFLLPLRSYSSTVVGIALRMLVPAVIFDLGIRILMDRQERAHFRWTKLLAATIKLHDKESQNLIHFLDGFMPSRVAERILESQSADGVATVAWAHMSRKDALMTAIEDQPFAVIQCRVDNSPGYSQQSRSSSMSGKVSVMIERLSEAIRTFNDQQKLTAPSTASEVRLVKADGDTLLLTADQDQLGNSMDSFGSGCSMLADAVFHLQSTVVMSGHDTRGWAMRCVIGACPMVGAVLGNHAPSFEWFAPELYAALRMVRMSDEASGPIFLSRVTCTDRVRHYMDDQGGFEGQMGSPAIQRRYTFCDRMNIKLCGLPLQHLSMLCPLDA